jgi:hypothetical protein
MMNPIFLFHVVRAYARVPSTLNPKGLGLRVLSAIQGCWAGAAENLRVRVQASSVTWSDTKQNKKQEAPAGAGGRGAPAAAR